MNFICKEKTNTLRSWTKISGQRWGKKNTINTTTTGRDHWSSKPNVSGWFREITSTHPSVEAILFESAVLLLLLLLWFEDCLALSGDWAASGAQRGRWVKPHSPFFHLSPGNESPDNTHTSGPGNWKAPVRLWDARPDWIWGKKGPRRHYGSFKGKDGASWFSPWFFLCPGVCRVSEWRADTGCRTDRRGAFCNHREPKSAAEFTDLTVDTRFHLWRLWKQH